MDALLKVENLSTHFVDGRQVGVAVDDLSFAVGKGEAVGLVGESGSGKSVTALSLLRLVPEPPGRIVSGKIHFEGRDLLALSADAMRAVRGARIGMVFQEPMTSLNPVLSVGRQITEVLEAHGSVSRKEGRRRAMELLAQVGLPGAVERLDDFPHRFSGGMRQRVMIAMALACGPSLLIADEPTTALDVTIQAQIMDLLAGLRSGSEMSLLLITHDLGLVAQSVERVLVMYAGQLVERAPVKALFRDPRHPYTRALMRSIPHLGGRKGRLEAIDGGVPSIFDELPGCRFEPRCTDAFERCCEAPPLVKTDGERAVRCWKYAREGDAS